VGNAQPVLSYRRDLPNGDIISYKKLAQDFYEAIKQARMTGGIL
jgi:hypothetical protein